MEIKRDIRGVQFKAFRIGTLTLLLNLLHRPSEPPPLRPPSKGLPSMHQFLHHKINAYLNLLHPLAVPFQLPSHLPYPAVRYLVDEEGLPELVVVVDCWVVGLTLGGRVLDVLALDVMFALL